MKTRRIGIAFAAPSPIPTQSVVLSVVCRLSYGGRSTDGLAWRRLKRAETDDGAGELPVERCICLQASAKRNLIRSTIGKKDGMLADHTYTLIEWLIETDNHHPTAVPPSSFLLASTSSQESV